MKALIICLGLCLLRENGFSQNVGLGVASPTRARFEVNGLVGNTTAIFGGDGAGIGLIATWPEIGYNTYFNGFPRYIANGYSVVQFLDPGNGQFGIDVHGTGLKDAVAQGPASRRAMTILNNGNVMLGLGSGSSATLNVGQWAGMSATAYFSGSTFNYSASEYTVIRRTAINQAIHLNYFSPNSKVVFGNGFGYVGVNWSIPVYPLEIHAPTFGIGLMRVGSENNWLLAESNSYLKLYFRDHGLMGAPLQQKGSFSYIDGDYSPISDERLKQNITGLEPMLGKLMQLQTSEYEMIANNPGHHKSIGLIAQEVERLFPELVHQRSGEHSGYTNMKDLYLMNYSALASIVIKSLQEQRVMLKQMELRVVKVMQESTGRSNTEAGR